MLRGFGRELSCPVDLEGGGRKPRFRSAAGRGPPHEAGDGTGSSPVPGNFRSRNFGPTELKEGIRFPLVVFGGPSPDAALEGEGSKGRPEPHRRSAAGPRRCGRSA
jgi:hypothetical protein